MIKNILIPLDGSEHSTAALDYGMWTAEKFNGTLFGQHVIDTMKSIHEGEIMHLTIAPAKKYRNTFEPESNFSLN